VKADLEDIKSLKIEISSPSRCEANNIRPQAKKNILTVSKQVVPHKIGFL